MPDLIPADATLDELRRAVEADPQWSRAFPSGNPKRPSWQHATATRILFGEKAPLRVDIPAEDYAGPITVDWMRREAIEAINSTRRA